MFYANTNFMRKQSARISTVSRAANKRSDYCNDGTFESIKSSQLAKNSNSLEEVEAGLIQSAETVYTEYPDPKRDEWHTKILPALKKAPRHLLMTLSPLSRTAITEIRAGRVPH